MRRVSLCAVISACALAAMVTGEAVAQPALTEHRTPAGIAFRHASMPGDTHHALAFAWLDGDRPAAPGKESLASVGTRLLMEGSRTVNESERIERLKDLQASIGLSGGMHGVRGSLTAPKATFAEAAGLLADLLADPALPEKKLAQAKRNAMISWPQVQENAETLASHLYLRLTLGNGPSFGALTGNPAAQQAVEVADVDAWRRTVLGREPAAIISAGPVAAEDVAREIDRIFAGLPAVRGAISPPPAVRAPGRLIVLERPVVQTAIVAGGPAGWTLDPDALQGTIAVRVLGSGFESRLTKAVRERLGAAYSIRAGLQQLHPKAFLMTINTVVDTAKAADVLAAIRSEYAHFRDQGVREAEIEPLKIRLITEGRDHVRRSPALTGRVRDLALGEFPADYLATYEARVRAVTADAVNEGIRTRLPAPPLTIVMVAPSAEGLAADCVIKTPEAIDTCE